MIDEHDPLVARALGDLAPAAYASDLALQSPSWDEVVAEATSMDGRSTAVDRRARLFGHRRRRPLLAAAVVLIAALAASLPASALVDKWFLHTNAGGVPSSDISLVRQGAVGGETWRLEAYPSTDQGLCVAVTVGDNGGRSCGAGIKGAPGTQPPHATSPPKDLGFLYTGVGNSWPWKIIAGPTAEEVRTVQVALHDGRVISAQTFLAPPDLALNVRFYAFVVPKGVDSAPTSVTALDANGVALQRIDLSAVTSFLHGNGS